MQIKISRSRWLTILLAALCLSTSADLFARGGGGGGGHGGGGFGGGGFHGGGGGYGGGGGGFHGGYGGGGYGGGGYGGGGYRGAGGYGGGMSGYRGGDFGGQSFHPAAHPDFGSAGNYGGHAAYSRSDVGRAELGRDWNGAGAAALNRGYDARPTDSRLNAFLGLPRTGGDGRPGAGLANAEDRGRGDLGHTADLNRPADRGLNNRPAWQNLNKSQLGDFHDKMNNAFNHDGKARQDMHNWLGNHPDRAEHWNN